MADIKSTCKCGATFNASGNSLSLGCRFREWLHIHQGCLYGHHYEQKEEE